MELYIYIYIFMGKKEGRLDGRTGFEVGDEVLVTRWFGFWLNMFNAELSPKRYWWGPKSQEVGEEGGYT